MTCGYTGMRRYSAERSWEDTGNDRRGAPETQADQGILGTVRFDFGVSPWDGDSVTTAQELIAELPGDVEVIPTPIIRGIVNDHLGRWSDDAVTNAIKAGAIRPRPERHGQGQSYTVDRDEAILILVAAALAFAAGIAVVSMIRAIRISGVDPAVFVQAT